MTTKLPAYSPVDHINQIIKKLEELKREPEPCAPQGSSLNWAQESTHKRIANILQSTIEILENEILIIEFNHAGRP